VLINYVVIRSHGYFAEPVPLDHVLHIPCFYLHEKLIDPGEIKHYEQRCRIEILAEMSEADLEAAAQFHFQSGRLGFDEARLMILAQKRGLALLLTDEAWREICSQEGVTVIETDTIAISGT